ncbi:hypothetical protein LRAMOSA06569 [Lichtheimia ramosa]|uniref:Uncharacterized protein n=1 Tax=Lichtheimia ramosa TaxID=688394 RepID=A0A077X476_9FUNG|nr:hypothetical protein LRAMOSA06569 [Lichtheimia ramosa]
MNTPPPEEEEQQIPGTLMPSMSTPAFSMTTRHHLEPRQRRHTIHRPDSTLEQLPEAHDEEQTFERISGILSTLLQEANNAVNATEYKQAPRWMQNKDNSDRMIQSLQSISKQISPVDLPRNANHLRQQQYSKEYGDDSSSSSTSTTTTSSSPELSPSSQSSSSSSSSSSSTSTLESTSTLLWRKGSAIINNKNTSTSSAQYRSTLLRGTLVESYKRLDHSMAMVDSLSRDLASSDEQDDKQHIDSQMMSMSGSTPRLLHNESYNTTTVDLRLSAFLMVPLLHIPQTLISWVFDALSNRDSSHLTGMLAWCFFFAFANVMVDQAVTLPATKTEQHSRNIPVPGSYHNKVHRGSTSSLFRRRNTRRVVMIPRRSSIYRKHYSSTTTPMQDAKTISPCRRISSIRMHPHRHLHSLTITRSHTQPPLDTTHIPPITSPLSTTLISTNTRRNSF